MNNDCTTHTKRRKHTHIRTTRQQHNFVFQRRRCNINMFFHWYCNLRTRQYSSHCSSKYVSLRPIHLLIKFRAVCLPRQYVMIINFLLSEIGPALWNETNIGMKPHSWGLGRIPKRSGGRSRDGGSVIPFFLFLSKVPKKCHKFLVI